MDPEPTDPSGALSDFLDDVERDVEASMRPQWERSWRRWWEGWKEATSKAPREVMKWALGEHSEGDPFDREAEEALTSEAPARGDWKALRGWHEATCGRAEEVLEEGALGVRPTDLPEPPFVPTEEELAELTSRAGKTPEGTAAVLLAHVGHVARFHHRYLQTHEQPAE
jgi:hypothetical protein